MLLTSVNGHPDRRLSNNSDAKIYPWNYENVQIHLVQTHNNQF